MNRIELINEIVKLQLLVDSDINVEDFKSLVSESLSDSELVMMIEEYKEA